MLQPSRAIVIVSYSVRVTGGHTLHWSSIRREFGGALANASAKVVFQTIHLYARVPDSINLLSKERRAELPSHALGEIVNKY
jgi:hypothetical protein